MRKLMTVFCAVSILLLMVATIVLFESASPLSNPAVAEEKSETGLAPVEDDMHEFMEYVFQPTYKRLRKQMALETKDRAAWKQIKSDALILAEGGNLTMMRGDNDSAEWNHLCQSVRDLGGKLYRSAKKKDVAASNTHYRAMISKCNSCHEDFAGGKHILKP